MSGRTDRLGSWGSRPDFVIAEAKAAARRALRQKHPRLTALERAFYERFKEELRHEAETLIQLKPPKKRSKKAA